MLVPKKDDTWRIVVDERLVNKYCIPTPEMSASTLDLIKMLNGAKIFTILDCKNAFYSLSLAEKDRQFTDISPPGLPQLELTRMPMGAKASTAALYRAVMNTLSEAVYVYVLVWADDILIYSQNIEDHIKHVDDVLKD